LNLKCDIPVSKCDFKWVNLHRCILGVSLWDADKEHLWHRCFNCYSKAIMYSHEVGLCTLNQVDP
jgi:hypothetical protein